VEALLQTDASVSVSFICEGSIPDELPSFVEVKPPQIQTSKHSHAWPFYQRRAPQLPDSLSRTIMRTNRFALSRVSVREKFCLNGAQRSVLQFLFTDGTAGIDQDLHTQGLPMLDQMLRVPWRKIFIFRHGQKERQTTVNISIGKNIIVPDGAVFAEPDQWGIRTLH